jgi:hypothetical protein
MAESADDLFKRGLNNEKDIYVVESTTEPVPGEKELTESLGIPLFHVEVEIGGTPDEAEIEERSAIWAPYTPAEPRLMGYEELAERQRVHEAAWQRHQAIDYME